MRRLRKRRIYTAFLAVWMTAQAVPIVACVLSASAEAATISEAPPSSSHRHCDERHGPSAPSQDAHVDHPQPANGHSSTGAHPGAAGCCDDPLMSCCIDAFRTMILASKDGTGCDHDHFGLLPPQVPFQSMRLVAARPDCPSEAPYRPPPASLAVVLRL